MRWCCALVLTILVASARASGADTIAPQHVSAAHAHADRVADADDAHPDRDDDDGASTTAPVRRTLAIAAAVFPGLILRGAGSWVVGEKRAAKRLAKGALGSLLVAGATGGLIAFTNASPYTMPVMPIVLTGVGGLLTSWVEDIWIAAGGAAVTAGPRATPRWSVEAGETWQHDAYRERLLQRAAATVWVGRAGASGSAFVDTGGASWLVLADLRARVIGDSACGNCLFVRAGGRLQRDRDDRVTQLVGEIEVQARIGLARFDRAFKSSFVELSTGLGANRVTYASMVSEIDSLLLGGFAWGSYVPGGEVRVYYDHRRDGLAGGIDAWRASGFIGSFGAAADLNVSGPWALRGELQIGNAYLTTLAVAYRGGAQ